jgi:hypothetical protein
METAHRNDLSQGLQNINSLIRSVMTYACAAWELAADTYLLKLQHMQNKVCAPLEIFQGAHRSAICIQLSIFCYVYNYITKLCRWQTEVIQNRENEHADGIKQDEARHGKYSYKRLNLGRWSSL